MKTLRKKLKKEHKKLYLALEKSWEIAYNEWLPALNIKNDSYNSYPHLRNIENHLNTIYGDCLKNPEQNIFCSISGPETYILLSSILFHDIGKIEAKKKHAKKSRELIRKRWAELGIVSYEMAEIIGKICEYHDPEGETITFHTITLDPYGEIRENMLGSLLRLADHLDSAYTRVLPTYLKDYKTYHAVGAFRKLISGVSVVQKAKYVKTVVKEWDNKSEPQVSFSPNTDKYNQWNSFLNNFLETSSKPEGFEEKDLIVNKNNFKEKHRISLNIIKNIIENKDIQLNNLIDIKNDTPRDIAERKAEQNKNEKTQTKIKAIDKLLAKEIDKVFKSIQKELKQAFDSYIREQKINSSKLAQDYAKKEIDDLLAFSYKGLLLARKDPSDDWPADIILSIIMNDLCANQEDLSVIKNDLASMGLPLDAWLLEYKDNLYNLEWEKTYEPIFNKDYLIKVVDAMWDLSTKVFGSTRFSYEDLAAQVRDPDVDRIKLAVRRLCILTNDLENDNTGSKIKDALWYSYTHWQWQISQKESKECDFYHYKLIHNMIENGLGDPTPTKSNE